MPRKAKVKRATSLKTRFTPEYMRALGSKGGKKTAKKKGKKFFSEIAKLSHKAGARDGYHGGRPRNKSVLPQ